VRDESRHLVSFASGRAALVPHGTDLLSAARMAGEPLSAECGGRGACGRCLVEIIDGPVPDYRILRREEGRAQVLACLTPVHGPTQLRTLPPAALPRLVGRAKNVGVRPLAEWAPWPLPLGPLASPGSEADLGAAIDVGTTTLRLVLIKLRDGSVVGEAVRYNPQIPDGADVISRIVASEKGRREHLTAVVRAAVLSMVEEAAEGARVEPDLCRAYVVSGNATMIHLLLGEDPSGIRRVPPEPASLSFGPVPAAALGWPGDEGALVRTVPAAGGWVGGDIVAGVARAGLPRLKEDLCLYVDLGTNGEIALGNREFALACACSAGPAFEGGGIRCGMRAERGAIDGARIDDETGTLGLSVVGEGRVRGVCGSGLIALTDALFRAGWLDRSGAFTSRLPARYKTEGKWGTAVALSDRGDVAVWERDIASLVRAKAAIFAGIRSLVAVLGGPVEIERVVVSGNFGRFLNLPAAIGIGLLPDLPLSRYSYLDNGALEGAALALLSRSLLEEMQGYLQRVTYVDLSELPGYMDEFVAASFLPHTSPDRLRLG
jgi:uncharacterized 2Fe-2S/4Fe-4S cluster protein (DUF4445 family)